MQRSAIRWAVLVGALLAAGCAWNGDPADPAAEGPASASPPASGAPAAPGAEGPTVDGLPFVPPGEVRISMSFDDADLWKVVRTIGKLAQADVVCDPSEITGRVTVNLVDVPWRRALESVAHTLGYVVVVDRGGVTHVLTRERALLLLEPQPRH